MKSSGCFSNVPSRYHDSTCSPLNLFEAGKVLNQGTVIAEFDRIDLVILSSALRGNGIAFVTVQGIRKQLGRNDRLTEYRFIQKTTQTRLQF